MTSLDLASRVLAEGPSQPASNASKSDTGGHVHVFCHQDLVSYALVMYLLWPDVLAGEALQ
jgi:hypothetical protein